MEIFMHHPKMLFLLCLLLQYSIYFATSQPYIGVNLGPSTRYRPDPSAQAKFLNSTYIRKLRMFTIDEHVIGPMADIDVSVVVGTPDNQLLRAMAEDPVNHCGGYFLDVFRKFNLFKQIHMILVGNKVLDSGDKSAIDNLLPAMQNMQKYVDNAGLHGQIKISTVLSLHALTNSVIPSNASFNPAYFSTIKPLLAFLRENKSPFMMETYPYYQYLDNPTPQMLAFCLFQPNAGQVDPVSGLKYMNMFDVKVDAFRTALNGLQYQDIEIVVAETGWPSNGDDNEIGATMENARLYNANLIHKLRSMVGTPLMPKKAVETYISSLFDEDYKEGPTSQRSFGIAHTDLTWKFNLYLDKGH